MSKGDEHKADDAAAEPAEPAEQAEQRDDAPAEPEVEADPLETLRQERDEALARLQRVTADYQNYQKRVIKQQAEARGFAVADVIRTLLPILDDFERSLEAAAKADSIENVADGLRIVHDHFRQALKGHDLEPIESVGKPFDPALHEAMMEQDAPDVPPRTVVQEYARGYRLCDRVLRPAKVVVSKAAEPAADEKSAAPDADPEDDNDHRKE